MEQQGYTSKFTCEQACTHAVLVMMLEGPKFMDGHLIGFKSSNMCVFSTMDKDNACFNIVQTK